ncbi:ATP-dependent helicase HrpB [Adhaeribacter radiodurans]|uniref:ATP-dependent helicase HrpB n=1 Tax=Adhaeribacter radiodurans TaxID=2745197 RepID=A0A7L7L7T9_9BACT|nr:ATP-dependent helicase HrpB [Adhaeribacter radiodurans]QMU28833.1 ATP-dependent helicase HrpB [Adhaeribacter radiodurans]
MPFNPFTIDLPVREIIPDVIEHLAARNTLIVQAPPGAGKSTLLPLALLNEPWLANQKIIMLEPRRLAARTIAERMSFLLGEELGQTVGYRIRFENRTSAQTRIEVVTEGILTRMLHSNNALAGVGLVIFDEFHERSIHADVAMALSREAQRTRRPDLRLLVMSATLDMPSLSGLLNAPVVQSEGRQYPVEIIYTGDLDESLLPDLTARTVQRALREKAGDVLVFLPGEGDIKKVEGLLRRQLSREIVIHPLFGMLPPNKQYAAIMPDRNGRRKVVLATSIAETSLTIEGVSVVVDCGYGKTSRFDPNSGLSRLETVQISKDAADQRAGRAGRLGPGTAYRLWTEATHARLAPHRTPEILEADLASLVLDMASWGIIDINQLTWLSPPPKAALLQATETLHQLNALEHGRITEHGRKMHALPTHPRIAHMLLAAEESDQLTLATDIAAILEERDPLPRDAGIDINLRIEALSRYRQENVGGKGLKKIEKIATQYRRMFEITPDNGAVDPYETGVLLAYCYPERIACARPGNNAQFQLANGKYAQAGHRDDLAHDPWLAVAKLDARQGMGKIFLASPLNPKDLAPLVKKQETITWDTTDGELTASSDLRIGSIVLQRKPLPTPDDKHRPAAISDALKREGEELLNFSEAVNQWQNRVLSLRKWRPQESWPDVSTPTLLATNGEWIKPYLVNVEVPEDLFQIDLLLILAGFLDAELQARLNSLAPAEITLPDGSTMELEYFANGAPPVLEIRLQDVLSWHEQPLIDEGEMSVELHLLTPDLKPLVVVSDLSKFWREEYPSLKIMLNEKFPKVNWLLR